MRTSGYPRGLAWPPLAYLILLFLIPTAIVVSYSCLKRDFYGQVLREWSAEGWKQAADPITLRILGRSVLLSTVVTLGCVLAGYPCALFLAHSSESWRRAGIFLIAFPLITSLLLRIYGWMNLLPLEWRGNVWTVGLVMMVNYLPFMVLPLLRACERLDHTLVEASLDLGATPWQSFWQITWPLTRAGLWAGCALVFIPSAGEYLVPHFIGEGKVEVLGSQIVKQFMERRNWPYAAACAVWLLALVALPALFMASRARESATRASSVERKLDAQ